MHHFNFEEKKLIEKYFDNKCTREELDQLLQIIENNEGEEELTQIFKSYWEKSGEKQTFTDTNLDSKFSTLLKEVKYEAPVVPMNMRKKKRNWKIQLTAAAIIICMFSVGGYFVLKPSSEKQIAKSLPITKDKNKITPGKNNAILTLADGSSIILDQAQNGNLATQGNTKILKMNGMLSYNTSQNKTTKVLYNTISTPRGGQYQLIFTDGTKVWLNAASSLRFPTNFEGKERKVELSGEAYFEVAKNKAMPFKVKVNKMEVEVLGTHFNINSYEDESTIRTTLLEGSVRINQNKNTGILKPGQQAQTDQFGAIKIINDADLEEAIAWKEEKFQFGRADIHEVMRQVARWYDVNIEYKGTVSSHFGGTISRNASLSQVLDMLHLTGKVKFEVKDRKIVVMPD
jgi:ferric-dicitrate binding protein FerR (iron transport regulator)